MIFAGCNCAHMDDIYDYDFGLTEEKIKQLSMKRARDMLAKSCTLEDKFSDIATVRWTIRHRLKLPELVKELILSFYPTAQIQLRGQKVLGLHNGHDYFFKGLATARAGDLMCDYKNQKLSVAQYCINIGCPVSPSAPVIKASRYVADLDFCEEVAVLPSEFAVLVPQTSFPCSSSRGSFFDYFDREDCFDDDDAQIFDESEEERESEEEIESDGPSISPAPKVRKIEKPSIQSREILPQDRELYWAVERGSDVPEDGKDLRQLLCDGANPTVPIRLPWKSETERSAISFAKDLVESWTNFQDQLQKHQLCPHQARDCNSVHCSFLYVCSSEEAEEFAQMFLEDLEMKKHFVALLTAAESVWVNARPSTRTLCSDNFLCGRGVICPDFELLRARLVELKVPDVSMVCEENVCRLAACMWDLAQKRQTCGKYPKTLCCRKAEAEAMEFEENVSRKVELMEKNKEKNLHDSYNSRSYVFRRGVRMKTLHGGEMSFRNACGLALPTFSFSKSQLSKGRRRRCSSCIACSILPGEAVSPWLTFDACQGAWKFPPGLMQFLKDAGYSAPTTLQAYLWPALIDGRDTVAIAKSGTGKTLSYLLPGFIKVARAAGNGSNSCGPRMLVMVPTRELWQQIRSESERFGRPANIATAGVFGAVPVEFASGQQCLVATPAHLNSSTGPAIDASGCQYLVVDQLDQMLNMGFEAQLLELPRCLPQIRQTAVYTTAWSEKIQIVARQLTKDALCVQVQ